MGGRKVCFIDEGQIATCIRDDENCSHCSHPGVTDHYKWVEECKKEYGEKSSSAYVNFYEKLHNHVHTLEQTVYGLRQMSNVCHGAGLEKISDDLAWRADNIDEIIEGFDTLLVAMMRQNTSSISNENEQLKQILKKIG